MGELRFTAVVMGILLCASLLFADGKHANSEAAKLLPDQIGGFKGAGVAVDMMPSQWPHLFGDGAVERRYTSDDGSSYVVEIQVTENDSAAYALLTQARSFFTQFRRDWQLAFNEVGTASFSTDNRVFFFKGTGFASVSTSGNGSLGRANELARQLAAELNGGEGEIPVLVKHLPQWETKSRKAVYSVTLNDLKEAITALQLQPADLRNKPTVADNTSRETVLDVLTFDGGTEAVTASYGQAQLVIVEFTTPQFSVDNDSRVWTKIAELKSRGQSVPNAYRRVGNYSVFVFNAPDEKSASALIDQVKYEQVVQWLGDDPHLYERLQRYFTQTSAGVLIAVLKSSGLSLVLCLAIGGVIGALLFRHRRAHRAAAFSDAGGSIRLNLDELTRRETGSRLLPKSNKSD